jgi:hypothetical protein
MEARCLLPLTRSPPRTALHHLLAVACCYFYLPPAFITRERKRCLTVPSLSTRTPLPFLFLLLPFHPCAAPLLPCGVRASALLAAALLLSRHACFHIQVPACLPLALTGTVVGVTGKKTIFCRLLSSWRNHLPASQVDSLASPLLARRSMSGGR